jgi:hypothetical protein
MKNITPLQRLGILILTLMCAMSYNQISRAAALTTAPVPAVPSGLSIAQLKITGDEFVVIKNNTSQTIPDLSQYWLEDFNSTSPLAAGASNSSQQLPAAPLDAGQTLLLSDATRATCSAELAGKLSVSLTDGGGFLELVEMTQTSTGQVAQTAGDALSWNSGTSGQIQSVPSSTKDPAGAYYRYASSATVFGWQAADVDASNACSLDVATTNGTIVTKQPVSTGSLLTGPDVAPASIISVADTSSDDTATTASLPAADIGLRAPEITELLPNPTGTGNDATDEYIELYNPNDDDFDLSGFTLQTGLTETHKYIFPNGTMLPAGSFQAYYSALTGLNLSNTAGQAKLLDPLTNVVAQSDSYGIAKDGVAWALANGKWYWTSTATPGGANVIVQPAVKKSTKKKATTAKKSTVSNTKTKSKKTAKSTSSDAPASSATANNAADVTPIHPWILALVGVLALLYGAYEYRADLANKVVERWRKLTARRRHRPTVTGR